MTEMMKAKKICRLFVTMLALFVLASCSNDPEWADPEAHEKTEQLQKQYGWQLEGTWYCEYTNDKQRFYERLTFWEDGTLTGNRKWQKRSLVTINGEQQYTDWEDMESLVGTFSGTWKLEWQRNENGVGENRLILYASFDEPDEQGNGWMAYSHNMLFDYDGGDTLRINGIQNSEYQRGYAEPSF